MTTASDSFTRANETPVAAPWTNVTPLGGLNLATNALTGVTDVARASLYNTGTWGNDQRVDVVVGNLLGGTRYAEAWVRGSTGGNGYKVYTDGTTGGTAIARMDAGVETSLQAVAVAFAEGDTLGIGIVGTTITLYKNGVAQTPTATSATYASGLPGAGAYGLATVDNWTADDGVSSATLDQEGARVGADDGSESTHTWLAAQDANATVALGTAFLVRLLVDGTGDPASASHVLRYQKNGAGGFVPVPVGASVAEAYGTVTFGAIGTGANGGTTVAPQPSSPPAGAYMLAVITSGATNSETPTAPDGTWTLLATGASTDGTYGIDTGPRRVTVFGKVATGTEGTTAVTFSITNGGTCRGTISHFTKAGAGAWDVQAFGADDSTSGTGVSMTFASMNWNTGDAVLVATGQRVDSATQSAQSLTAAGVTFGALTNRAATAVTTGNDHRHTVDTFAAISSTSDVDAAPTWSYTASAAASAGGVIVRLREYTAPATNELYIAPSANIAAGGEATTARLTAPSGKTTADFVIGRRWDDENGTDAIDITLDDYTELEWSLNTQSPAVNGDAFQFRVYAGAAALSTYSVTPQVTLSGGGASLLVPARRRHARRVADEGWISARRQRAPLASIFASNAQVLQLGGTAQSEQAGGVSATPGPVTLAIGGGAELERAGGATASPGAVSLALGGLVEREIAGGAQLQPGTATVSVGGNSEQERPGGSQAQAGQVTLQVGGAAEAERPGGVSAQAGAQTVSVGGTVELERAGGAAVASGPVTLALGGAAERETAGGVIVGAGVQVLGLGGSAELERAGGAQAQPGQVQLAVGGALEREAAGGASVQAGVQTIAVGGTAEPERAGGTAATAGAVTLQVGGGVEREQSGGSQASPGAIILSLGGCAERESAGGVIASITAIVLNLGGTGEREAAGGSQVVGSDMVVAVGGTAERERPGGAVIVDRSSVQLTEELLTAVLRTVCPRVVPDVAPLGTVRPYITYQAIGGQAWRYVDLTAADKRHTMVQINVWADTRRQARDLIQSVEDALCAATTIVAWPMAEAMSDSTELADRILYGSLQDFEVVAAR